MGPGRGGVDQPDAGAAAGRVKRGGAAARALHPQIGAVFGVGLLFMFALWVRDMFLDGLDRQWLGAVKHYAAHERDKVPPAGKYNAGQKLFFWVQSLLGIVFVLTG